MKKRFSFQDRFFLLIVSVLVLVILYSGLRILESAVLRSRETDPAPVPSKTITRNEVEYFPRQDITVIMVLGIDRDGPVASSNYYRNSGAADSVMLLIFDEAEKTGTVLCLDRDTMLDMDVLGVRGEYAGTAYGQLALAHTYGTGLQDSCENVKNTLMRFLHGLTVDYYIAMHMDAIPILNDAVGGVTVTVTEDFSRVNPTITMGELTLRGSQAIDYVRTRKDVGDQTNATRIERQQAYVDGFLQALHQKTREHTGFLLSAFESAAPYMVTDCSGETLSAMMKRFSDFTFTGAVTPEGESIIEDGHYAFYADEEKLDALILDLFYRPKK